jgi:hypothetical protein
MCTVAIMLLLSTIAVVQGIANADFIKKTRGIDIPWWEAAFYQVNVASGNVDVTVSGTNIK